MANFQIKHRYSGTVLFECEVPEQQSGMAARYALEQATTARANLGDANLRGANLGGANLRGANLGGADLRGANLGGADLRDADLRGANLGGANLRGANLGDANLRGANLRGANLGDANLRGANLGDADLGDANLRGADLGDADLGDANLGGADLGIFKTDFFDILLRATREVPALRAALVAGKVDGSTYSGECACLVGTIANARGSKYQELGNGIKPNSSRPAEQWFMSIKRGDTPETNQISAITVEWVDEFTGLLAVAVAA
jgi:hypothetical protein